jgi:hypothetical protein
MRLWIAVCNALVATACQQPAAAPKEESAPPRAAPERSSEVPAAARFDSPRSVYKRYAETLNASQWADAIALFTPSGKAELVLANFKGLAVLPGSPHPKKNEFKAVMREFCQRHALRCADDKWNETFAPTLLAGGNVTTMLSDVANLAKAKPEATYIEIMKLITGVDQGSVMALDPTLTEVRYDQNKATGTARRADGQTTTMSFEDTPDRGWMIVE